MLVFPVTGVTVGCELPSVDLLEEQEATLTTELTFWPQ